jgi:hypothetical protein
VKVLGQYACLFGLLLILTGCDNKNLAIWSPDGSKLGMIAAECFHGLPIPKELLRLAKK